MRKVNDRAIYELKNHQMQLDMDGVMVGVSREALEEVLSAIEAAPVAVKVCELPWVKHPAVNAWRADTMLGSYQIWAINNTIGWLFDSPFGERIDKPTDNEDQAFAAAQADYERRILSAIEAAPVSAEPQPDLFELLQVAFRRGANWLYVNGSAEGLNKAAYDYADCETSPITKEERARAALADQKDGA